MHRTAPLNPAIVHATPEAIADAAARLVAGELVAFPTETVYGLDAYAGDPAAVRRIFAAKGRPADPSTCALRRISRAGRRTCPTAPLHGASDDRYCAASNELSFHGRWRLAL